MATHLGLTSAQVAERVKRGQTNNFKARVGRSYWDIFRDNVLNLFNIVLFTLLIIVLFFRDYATVIFSGFSVVSNTFLGMIQEISAKRKLDQMASLASQDVRVWRDGELKTIPMYQVVLDDVIAVEPGDRIVVDGKVLTSDALEVDESQLTGESDAVFKSPDDSILSGSFCIAGSGTMVATQVGKDSGINKLSAIAKQYKNVQTPTQKKIAAIVEISVLVMFILGPMLLVAGFIKDETLLGVVRNAVVFITSLVPQGLVLVAILSLTIGAVRISLHKTLIQRVNAVESLANVTVLCFDKTGTLTQNKLAVTEIIPLNGAHEAQIRQDLNRYVCNLSYQNRTAGAITQYMTPAQLDNTVGKVREIPFTSGRKWGAIVFPEQTFILGAPERVIQDPSVAMQAYTLSEQGMRVLAFARCDVPPDGSQLNGHTEPVALIVASDQMREDITTTLDDFRALNVALKVVSGDNVETVRAIARAAGMEANVAYTGEQLKQMTDVELEAAVIEAEVFARVEPDTKERIVRALQRRQQYVAMVGDGVNDVPALKAADLAIVMNDGTQISKDVADIVLLNNAMSTLPLAFREGREITQTIFGTMKMFLTKNVYNVLMFIFILFMALPFPITPAQISWSAFGTVNMPATFIAFGLMRPKYIERFRRDVFDYLLTAGVLGAVALAVLFFAVYQGTAQDIEITRSAITLFVSLFGMMVVWNVQGVEFYQPRTFIQNSRVVILSGIVTLLTMLSFYVQPGLFQFQAPPLLVVLLIVALFNLTMVLINHGMEHRYLVNRLWMLVER